MGSLSAENEAKAKLVADHVRELLEAAGYVGVTVQPMDAGGMIGFIGRWKIQPQLETDNLIICKKLGVKGVHTWVEHDPRCSGQCGANG